MGITAGLTNGPTLDPQRAPPRSPAAASKLDNQANLIYYKPMLFRAITILMLFLFAGQATGAWALLEESDCQESCPGDDARGGCPPTCQSCDCCAAVGTVLAPSNAVVRVCDSDSEVHNDCLQVPPPPEPREIQHVPKPLLS